MPFEELRGPYCVERVLTEGRVEQLEHRVPRPSAGFVFGRLLHELLEIRLALLGVAAGELHERAHCDVEILHAEHTRTVTRHLALPIPLEQRELERQERHAGEKWKV